jgi:hypothetical protein
VRLALVIVVAFAAGCSARGSLQAGSSYTSSTVGLSVRTHAPAAALIGLGLAARALHGGATDRAPPEPDPTRSVREQDCTRPIEDLSANLRCR